MVFIAFYILVFALAIVLFFILMPAFSKIGKKVSDHHRKSLTASPSDKTESGEEEEK